MAEKQHCKWCNEEWRGRELPCYKHCQESADGNHQHDPRGFVQADCDNTVDVTCKFCGQSGGVIITVDDIQWD